MSLVLRTLLQDMEVICKLEDQQEAHRAADGMLLALIAALQTRLSKEEAQVVRQFTELYRQLPKWYA